VIFSILQSVKGFLENEVADDVEEAKLSQAARSMEGLLEREWGRRVIRRSQ
jgi:hypothetical protein